ncbi:unnamed protein product [Clonostachys rhizophaga]|uniref:FAD-binding domain-containing protein n=1 Tax=Clonostachys rhizophaga TaxID=160324 RepID=A0A9N9VNL6_9HYPO|nr:unnamed protein product [Clonostachys rhizophaga]
MVDKDFKVVIAGGGIAGLGLANMLEMAGIDWVLLESHSEIAPQVGASIGLFPNGLRILDQMGVYEAIRATWGYHPMSNTNRDAKGRVICFSPGMGDHLEERHGYPFIFIDRRSLLQILFDNLKHKDRVHLGKKVAIVDMGEQGVKVTTADGDTLEGDILVGADGVHSRVREEMWRIGERIQPGVFLEDRESPVSCRYKCVFGISEMSEGLDSNEFVCGDGHSYLISPGPGKRTYWFLFANTGNGLVDRDQIPRYTKDEETSLVQKHLRDPIAERHTFGDLYESRLYSTLTPLVEHVFKRWHFGRIMLLGDSAHKHNPIAGQGGMSALESGAALINELQSLLKRKDLKTISNDDYDSMLTRTQRRFETRVKGLVKAANDQQRLLANDHPMSGLVPGFLGTVGGLEYDLGHLKKRVVGAISLRDFPPPKRPRLVPFTDELPARPVRKMWKLKWLSIMMTGYIFFCSRELYNLPALRGSLDDVVGWGLRQTHVSFLMDQIWSTVMPTYSHLILEHGLNKVLVFIETILILMSLVTIWTIEGYRLGHQRSIIRWPIMFWVALKMKGLGCATSLYFILNMAFGSNTIIGRPVPPSAVKAAALAFCIVYFAATALMVVPNFKEQSVRISFGFLQSVPVYIGVLTALFTAVLSQSTSIEGLKHSPSTSTRGASDKGTVVGRRNCDVVYLNRLYILLHVSLGTIHLGTAIFVAVKLRRHFSRILQSSNHPFPGSVPGTSERAYSQLIWDLIFASTSLFVFLLHTVWNLRGTGYISTLHAFKVTMMVLVGQIIAGPGATYAALWYWRENLLSGLSEQYY